MARVLKIFILCILIICIPALSSCSKSTDLSVVKKERKIALIMKMNSGYHWGTIKQGAETAGREFNVNVVSYAPDDEKDVEGQIKLVNEAINDKDVNAIILAASDYNALVEVTQKAYAKKIPVIIIDSEVNTRNINSYIATDNLEAGKKAGRKLVDLLDKNKANRVAIMSFVKGSRNAEQREEGLLSVISQNQGIEVVSKEYSSSDTKLAYQLTKKIISTYGKIDAIVALNAISAEGVALAISEMKLAGKVKVISFDSTPNEIDYMEKGVIQATITQNPFSMGYLGVKYAVDIINGKEVDDFKYTESKIIERENMYLPENQKLLFPFVK